METKLCFQSKECIAELTRMLEILKDVSEKLCNSFIHVVEAYFGLSFDLSIHGKDIHAVPVVKVQRGCHRPVWG